MKGVLLTDGLQRKTLSAVRSLGTKGITTYVGEKIPFSPAGCSRYCYDSFVYPDPNINPNDYYQYLLKQIQKTDCNILFPMDDITLSIIMDNREELEKNCILPLPKKDSYHIASDKYETYLLAEKVKVASPKSYLPHSIEELEQLAISLEYPLIIKPRKSSGSRGIRVANDREELMEQYDTIHQLYPNPMIQEYIPQGSRFDVCLLYDRNHQLKASFIQKEIRHFPIEMGPSTVQESLLFPELLESSKRLMEKLEWTGIVEIEFMIDPRCGTPKLMEINPRFWSSLELAVKCGVDFPFLLYKVALNQPFESVFFYEIGKKTRWLIPGDILHFLTNKQRFQMNPPFIGLKRQQLIDDSFLISDPLPTIATIVACVWFGLKPSTWKMMLKR